MSLTPVGRITVGATVEANRDSEDEDAWETCTVKAVDKKGAVDLSFEGGFVAKGVPVSRVRLPPGSAEALEAASKLADEVKAENEALYMAEVEPLLPTPPSEEAAEADPEAKYTFIRAFKDVGNTLFKQGKYMWAIRTYVNGVDRLVEFCYPSRERMLWDYFARGPCAQCYSNAALCALKEEDHVRAGMLCARALECKPEGGDLVKVLLRQAQAHLGTERPGEAKDCLSLALEKEPNNRAVREEMVKAKKMLKEHEKEAASRLFQKVDLTKKGLTSKREHEVSEYEARLEHGLDALVAARDKEAIEVLTPLLSGASNTAAHRRPQYLHAAYAVGCALYHTQNLTGAATWLGRAFRTLEDLVKEGVEFTPLALGLPLGRFYYAHALFNGQDLRGAKAALLAYVDDVAVAGPQRVLNMPSALSGKDGEISDLERGASRFRARSCSTEAQADAQTMLAMIAEKEEGPEAAGKVLERVLELSTHDRQLADTYDALFKVHTKLGDENKASQCKALAKEHRDKWEASEEEKKALKKKEEAMEEDQVLDEADAPEVVPELAEPGVAEGVDLSNVAKDGFGPGAAAGEKRTESLEEAGWPGSEGESGDDAGAPGSDKPPFDKPWYENPDGAARAFANKAAAVKAAEAAKAAHEGKKGSTAAGAGHYTAGENGGAGTFEPAGVSEHVPEGPEESLAALAADALAKHEAQRKRKPATKMGAKDTVPIG